MNEKLAQISAENSVELSSKISDLGQDYTLEECTAAYFGNLMAMLERHSPTERRITLYHIKKTMDAILAQTFADENIAQSNGENKSH